MAKFGALLCAMLISALAAPASAQELPPGTNVDEAKVGDYTLPELMRLGDGALVRSREQWTERRRPELLELFAAHQFGRTPDATPEWKIEIVERDGAGLGGIAHRRQVRLTASKGDRTAPPIRVVLYTPNERAGPAPVLLHIGFSPNMLVFDEPGIDKGFAWDAKTKTRIPDEKALMLPGFDAKPFIERGFAVAHVYYGDIEPDFDGGSAFGIRTVLGGTEQPRRAEEWGAIGAWSWGLSRIVDWLVAEEAVDSTKIALSGASRLGKTILWAAAQDERFALIFPIISGEGGAAISRRNFGETVADLTDPDRYPYWFAPRYADYADDVSRLPVDAHMLLATIAPRPMLLINGDTDGWSDWRGEQLAAEAARPAWALFGRADALENFTHHGGHKLLPEDLQAMAAFMTRHFDGEATEKVAP